MVCAGGCALCTERRVPLSGNSCQQWFSRCVGAVVCGLSCGGFGGCLEPAHGQERGSSTISLRTARIQVLDLDEDGCFGPALDLADMFFRAYRRRRHQFPFRSEPSAHAGANSEPVLGTTGCSPATLLSTPHCPLLGEQFWVWSVQLSEGWLGVKAKGYHPLFAWFGGCAVEAMSKYEVGSDGRTGYEWMENTLSRVSGAWGDNASTRSPRKVDPSE